MFAALRARAVYPENGMLSSMMAPSGHAASSAATPPAALDRAVAIVREQRRVFARCSPAEKAALLRSCLPLFAGVAAGWAAAACKAKGLRVESSEAGEEWIGGPVITVRDLRLLAASLEEIAERGRPAFGRAIRQRSDGRVEVLLFPAGGFDAVLYKGLSCTALLQTGWTQARARESQASFYQRTAPEGGVSLVLGAGNVSSIPATDALHKMFVDGNVCVLKMNPVNEWAGPFLEKVFAPLIAKDFLRIVYGGAEVGEYLCQHGGVDDIHITGSSRTHDHIVWGPPGREQDRRRAAGDPVLRKTITSELGNVSPVVIVPGNYTDEELWFQAKNLTTMIVNNASFNCNAAKVIITAKGWSGKQRFFQALTKALASAPAREAYYPGARDRYEELTRPHPGALRIGAESNSVLPWTLIRDVDATRKDEPLFQVEPFCSVVTHTEIGTAEPAEFLAEASGFCNDRLWGTLNACLVIDPRSEADPAVAAALERAIVDLRYGTVAVNQWPAVVFGAMSPPWGGHPSATLADVQSGIGFVHNTFMLEGIDKAILRGPLVMSPKPAWFFDNKMMRVLGEKMVDFQAAPSAFKLPGLAITALRG